MEKIFSVLKELQGEEKFIKIIEQIVITSFFLYLLSGLFDSLHHDYFKYFMCINLILQTVGFTFLMKDEYKIRKIYFLMLVFCVYAVSVTLYLKSGFGTTALMILMFMTIINVKNIEWNRRYLFIVSLGFVVNFIYWFLYSLKLLDKTVFYIGYMNPNQVAMRMLLPTIFLIILVIKIMDKYTVLSVSTIFVISFYTIYLNSSRAALLVLVFFMFMLVVNKLIKIVRPQTVNVLLIITFFLTVVVPILLVLIYKYDIKISFSTFNKVFYTGRERLWLSFFTHEKMNLQNYIIGIGTKVSFWRNHGLHNDSLFLIQHFGVIGLVIYLLIIYNILNTNNMRFLKSHKERLLLLFLFAFLFYGILELAAINSKNILIYAGILGFILRYSIQEEM